MVSLTGASNEKDTARRAGVRNKQGEEGCDKTKKGSKEGEREDDALPSIGTPTDEDASTKDGKVETGQGLG